MSFERTRRHLKRMEDGELTTCELFACFYDLCEDMKVVSGQPISKLPTGEADQLVRPLGRIAKLVTTTAGRVEDPKWRQTIQELAQENETIRISCDTALEDLAALEKEKKEKEQLLTDAQKAMNVQAQKWQEIAALDEELRIAQIQMDRLERDLSRYEDQKKLKEALAQKKIQQTADLEERKRLSDELVTLQEACGTAKADRDAMARSVADAEAERKKLEQEIAELRQKVHCLDMELGQYMNQKKLKEALAQKKMQQTADLEERKRLSHELVTLQEACGTAKADRDAMARSVADAEAERKKLEQEIAELRQKVDRLDTELGQYTDQKKEKEQLEVLRQKKAGELRIREELRQSIQMLTDEIGERCIELERLTSQKTELETERSRLTTDLKIKENALNLAKKAISPEELSRQRGRLNRLTRALEGLDEEQRALGRSFPELGSCQGYPAIIRERLQSIKNQLSQCEEDYRTIIRVLESEKESER